MLKLGILLIAMGFFIGCTTQKEDRLMQSYKEQIDYHKQLQKTEKLQLFEDNVTKIVLTATYLYTPNFKKNDLRDEEFILGVHFEDEDIYDIVNLIGLRNPDDIRKMREKEKEKPKYVSNSLYDDMTRFMGFGDTPENDDRNTLEETNSTVLTYGLTLENKNAIQIKELNKNNKRLKRIPYVTEWGFYYLVTFEHTNSKQFTLDFLSEKYGKGTFSFAKVAKYIYTDKEKEKVK